MRAPRRRWLGLGITFLVVIYVGSYLLLSRLGFARADAWNMLGFYFIQPHPDHNEQVWLTVNGTCVFVFYPLVQVDRLLGTGREPAMSAPMWHIAGGEETASDGDP